MKNIPKIGIIIPVLDESVNLQKLLVCLENQREPELISLIVIAAGDKDLKKYEMIRNSMLLLKEKVIIKRNEKRYTPSALNLGIQECLTNNIDVIQFLGAHSLIKTDFIFNLYSEIIKNPEVDIFNSALAFTDAETLTEKAIQLFTYSRLGRNWRLFLDNNLMTGFVTGIFAVRSGVILKTGMFDERFHKNQDIQFIKRAFALGFKARIFNNLVYYYKVRPSINETLKQMFSTGKYISLDMRSVNAKHLAPFIFYTILIFLILLFLTDGNYIFIYTLLIIISLYLVINIAEAVRYLFKNRKEAILLPFIFITSHLFYAAGTFYGLFRKMTKT
jgi:glycosyltransferase involved in cell wall biosynthesis